MTKADGSVIKTIFFDLGGVILSNGWDRHQRKRVLTALGADLDEYEKRHEDANYFWERGLETDVQYFARTLFYKQQPFTLEQVWEGMGAEQTLLYPGTLEVLKALAATGKYSLATLNNESRELNVYRLNKFGLRAYFDFLVCSGYVHEMKPAPGIYREAIEVSGRLPEETVFIDDKEENVAVAQRFGMNGIHFTSPEQLREELTKLGVEL